MIGGVDVHDRVGRLLRCLSSNEVAKCINWIGKKIKIELFSFKPQEHHIWLVRIEHCLILYCFKNFMINFQQ